jgi:hypothetical protein
MNEMGVVASFTTTPLKRFLRAGGAVVPARRSSPYRCPFCCCGGLEDLYEPLLAKLAASDEAGEAAILKDVAAFCGERAESDGL